MVWIKANTCARLYVLISVRPWGPGLHRRHSILIRPCEVLSRVANVTILEVANNALRVLLQHRHVIIGSLA